MYQHEAQSPELHSHQAGIGGRPVSPVVRVVDEIQWRIGRGPKSLKQLEAQLRREHGIS